MILSLILLLLHTPEPEEIRLFNKINEYRIKNGKTALSYCDSLSYVAETHSIDMYFHFDIDNPCSLHTWSFSKFWTGGCIPEGKNDQWHIMYNKPKEITPKDAFDGWIASTPHRNVILEKGWDRPFVRMGVSIYKGIANVWFAQE